MFTHLHCVALRTSKYSDRYSILSVYTLELGRQSLLIPATGGKAAGRYRALTMPFSAFECIASISGGREVHPIKDLRPDRECIRGDFNDPRKNVVAFFLSEFFSSLLREPVADPPMFRLMRDTIKELTVCNERQTANLHILTMIRTATLMGIEPDTSTAIKGSFFDMAEGVWRTDISAVNSNSLLGEKSRQALLLARMSPRNYGYYKMNRFQRNEAIDMILKYFHIHGMGKNDLPALSVLRELF